MPLKLTTSDPQLIILADLIQQKTGLSFGSNRLDLLADRLTPLIEESGMPSAMDYYYFLKYDPEAEEEWRRVQSALAINETYFWREYSQIQAAVDILVPRMQQSRPGVPVRIWHAACATGEEPYTMAISLLEAGRYLQGPIEIRATDFNQNALELARKGIYRGRSFRSIPAGIQERYFTPAGKDTYQITENVRGKVQFSYMNLLDETMMSEMVNYDIILCRNAFIYFSDAAIRRVTEWLDRSLNPEGILFVAAAESLVRLTNRLELVEVGDVFGYQKRSHSENKHHA